MAKQGNIPFDTRGSKILALSYPRFVAAETGIPVQIVTRDFYDTIEVRVNMKHLIDRVPVEEVLECIGEDRLSEYLSKKGVIDAKPDSKDDARFTASIAVQRSITDPRNL